VVFLLSIFVARRPITPTFVFLAVCDMCFLHLMSTLSWPHNLLSIFLGYSAKYKGYHCWDPVARRMRTSRDVVFDESCPFYLRPTTNASPVSLVGPLSFLLFPDAPPASVPIPRSTLSSSMSSSESPPVVSDYTMKPPVTQFYNRRGA
jgi:hypothetical protein